MPASGRKIEIVSAANETICSGEEICEPEAIVEQHERSDPFESDEPVGSLCARVQNCIAPSEIPEPQRREEEDQDRHVLIPLRSLRNDHFMPNSGRPLRGAVGGLCRCEAL